jgi:linoleoyl-CoA desaturase
MAPRVRAICERYGQRYCTGSFGRQLGSVVGKILRYALPGGKRAARTTPPVDGGRSTATEAAATTTTVSAMAA